MIDLIKKRVEESLKDQNKQILGYYEPKLIDNKYELVLKINDSNLW